MSSKYSLNNAGDFVIENYNLTKPFASFFPGIAGRYGIPMWVFYVNRAQAIVSFGTQDKDHSISEFYPANKAWQLVSTLGFRTFIKIDNKFYEPFSSGYPNLEFKIDNRIFINSYELKLEEINSSLGIKINIEYFTLPSEPFAGLVRILKIKNLRKRSLSLRVLDGLPQVVPYGINNLFLKKLSRTIEAWMKVRFMKDRVAIYKIDVDPHDRPEILYVKGANFYLSFHYKDGEPSFLKPIVEPDSIFGPVRDFSLPYNFYYDRKINFTKIPEAKTPCGFVSVEFRLIPEEEKNIYSLIGYTPLEKLLEDSLKRITKPTYLLDKREENKRIITDLQKNIHTESGSKLFNLYAKQTYLDNLLRGGYPCIFKSTNSERVFYIYNRKHGDLERDYNKFELQATYLSQGNGNFRDLNQNRRCDIWFYPQIGQENIIKFFNLIQTDGFNPLVIKETLFTLKKEEDFKEKLKNLTEERNIPKILAYLKQKFNPGEFLLYLEENNIKLNISYDEFIGVLFSFCEKEELAEHTDGYWTDHWTYNLDLLENYLKVYPEEQENIIFKKRVFSFYDNSRIVRPRKERYVLLDNKVRQLKSVVNDPEKEKLIHERKESPYLVREDFGKGKVYYTTLLNKLLC
ncbi:MAG: cellobiose phosphorylase, partial [Candidatus Omnitrophica bacterium]|nr:cellobiose phosphorylase [Candidatus Omnitrophota bacterium]